MIQKVKNLLFKNITVKQTVIKNVFWLGIGQIGSRLIRAIIIIYAARILGASEYGIFSYVLGFAGFFTLFSDIGVNPLLTRNIAGYPEKRNEYFSASFWIKIFLLLFTVLLIVFVAPHFTNIKEVKPLIPFIAFLIIFDGLRELATAYLRGVEKMEREALILIVMNITIVIAGFIILSISPNSKSLIFSYIASVGVSAGLAIFITKNQFLKVFQLFNKNLICEIFRSCWPIAFSGMLGIFMLNIDIIMLGWWRSAEEIGYYSAGQRIIQVLYTLPSLLAAGIFPALSRIVKEKNQPRERILNEKSITIALSITIPLVIGGIILGQPIFRLIFGEEYLPGVLAFQILMSTFLITSPSILMSNLVLAHNQQRKILKYIAIGSIGNVIFNILLIPTYGIAGSAIATVIALLLNGIPTWYHLKKISNFYIVRHLKKIAISAIAMGIFTFILNKTEFNIFINIILSAGVYLGLLYILKEKILEEIKPLIKAVRH